MYVHMLVLWWREIHFDNYMWVTAVNEYNAVPIKHTWYHYKVYTADSCYNTLNTTLFRSQF